MYLVDTVLSYLLIYKRAIIQANQKAYVINLVRLICILVMSTSQILCLVIFKSYTLFLVSRIIFRLLENAIIACLANKMYPYIKDKNVDKIDSETISDVIKKVKALVLHKIGSFVVNGSDNLIITKFLGLSITGLYTNYNLIVTSLNSLFNQAFASIAGSVGNLVVEKDSEKSYNVYKKLLFFNAWVYTFFVTCFFSIIEPFIKIWLGEGFLLPTFVVVTLVINFYLQGVRNTINLFKDSAGIFYEDRFMPIIEVITNLIISIVLAKLIGLPGVIIGTIISTLIVCIYGHARYVYKPLFNRNRISYLLEHSKYILLAVFDTGITFLIISFIKLDNNYLQCVVNICICIVIPNLINFIILRKTEEFKYYFEFLKKIIKSKIVKKIKTKSI